MSWDVAVFGELKFPRGALSRWRELEADPSSFRDWKGHFEAKAPASSVADVLQGLEALAGEEAIVDVSAKGNSARVRALLPKDPFLDWAKRLAAAFRAAAGVGGEGALHFVGYETISLGYRVAVQAGQSTFEVLDRAGITAAEETPGFEEVGAMVHEAMGDG
jgi:hypothetical protein